MYHWKIMTTWKVQMRSKEVLLQDYSELFANYQRGGWRKHPLTHHPLQQYFFPRTSYEAV
jgi:hypothetical protein